MSHDSAPRVAVIGGARTPFAKAGTVFREKTPLELAVHSVDGLLEKQDLDPGWVEELVYGITTHSYSRIPTPRFINITATVNNVITKTNSMMYA